MHENPEKLDALLTADLAARLAQIDFGNVHAQIASHLASTPSDSIFCRPYLHQAVRIAAGFLLITALALVAFFFVPSSPQNSGTHVAIFAPSARVSIELTPAHSAAATVAELVLPESFCRLEIIDLEKYGYMHGDSAAYIIITLPPDSQAKAAP